MGRIKTILNFYLWTAAFILHLSCLHLWGLNPDKSIDEYLVDQWKTSEGLPSNTINSIVQTPDGYLWLASSSGLVRFDGIKFSNIPFAGKEEISPRGPTEPITLMVSREGALWIGTTTGLTRFRNGKFKTFTTADGLTGNRIRCIAVDMKDNLWVSYIAGYLDRFSRDELTTFNASKGLERIKVNAIVEDGSGNLLFATREKGVFSFKEDRFSPYPIPGLDNLNIINMYQDHKGCLWIATNKGLVRVDEDGTIRYRVSHGLSHDYVMVITEDSERNPWVGTLKGLNRLKRKEDGTIVFESLLKPFTIFYLYEDREKSLWIGTENSGLKRLKERKFNSFSAAEALEDEITLSLFLDRKGHNWIGTLGGKLFHFRENQLIETIEPPGLAGTGISAIAEDSGGNLWLGTMGKGVIQIKEKTFVPFTTKQGLTGNLVTSIYKDRRGSMWVGTFAGVSIIHGPGTIETFTSRQGLAGKVVHNVCENKSGDIWITADQGITVLKEGKTTKQAITTYLQGIPAVSIYEDPSPSKQEEPVYWISSKSAGLKRLSLKDNTIVSYTTQQGMDTNSIYQFFEEQGYFWLMSNRGILRVSKSELNRFAKKGAGKINCTTFGRADGMQSTEFHNQLSRHSALQTKEGDLWFVTKKGIAVLNPGKIRVNKEPPPVVIESVLFDGRSLALPPNNGGYRFKGIKKVTFGFTAPSFLSPGKIKFKYKLEGFDREWVFLPAGKKRAVDYRDLSPRTYTFRVTACNAEGVWNPTGASVTFTLEAFFYQTILFKALVLFLFIIATALILYLYKKNPPARRATKSFDQTFSKVWPPAGPPEATGKQKYKSSNLTPEFAVECEKKLKHLMEVDKIYRDESISLQSLAEKISTKPYIISQVLNERLNRNFYDFINYYRIEEAKMILKSPDKAHMKIAFVGDDVGFNTTAGFYKAFKEYTGMTPNQYKKKAV